MIDRRKLLAGTGAAALAAWTRAGAAGETHVTSGTADLVHADEEREQVLYELARLDARYYTEEGVAMVLACEDLDPEGPGDFVPREINERFSVAYRHYADLLGELRRDLGEQDAVAVLELLAYRDFESGGGNR